MAARKPLRVVSDKDQPQSPPTLLEAVESGDMLAIMKAQRRIIAESLTSAAENTRPQYSNELNKLNALIREEESRRSVDDAETSVVAPLEAKAWDGTGY
jgi:hypothetical protein